MIKPSNPPLNIFLKPGEYCFAEQDTRIRTVLGSCVSITFWHPQLRVGGMCHYMLPKRSNIRWKDARPAPDGRYADEAIALMLKKIDVVGAAYKEYQVTLLGGSHMFPGLRKNMTPLIGDQNVQAGRQLIKHHRFLCMDEYQADTGYLNVVFEVWSGAVWIKRGDMPAATATGPLDRSLK